MINNQYKLFMDSILALAETIVIKFEDYASPMNLHVIENHGIASVDEYDKASWKYYQNITGVYHFSDEPMYVSSMDLSTTILFSKENLTIHQSTKSAYAYGSRYYNELVQQYPDQEQLILGILYPCDMATALSAKDGTILGYPSHLVETYEATLIPNLQKWIDNYLGRWVNRPFAITEDLYTATYTGQLYLHLVGAITNARLAACHTEEVHSFHLQQYLASHGHLDKYIQYLTREQALFLYRNINYLQRYAGKIDTFDWLVDKIITLRGFPLYSYTMNHQTELLSNATDTSEAVILPDTIFLRKGVNSLAQVNAREVFSLDQVLFKTEPLAPGNPEYQTYNSSSMRSAFAYSPSAIVNTKLLESSAVDYSTVVGYTIEAIALQHWLRHASKDKYQASISLSLLNNPSDTRVTPQGAVALFMYCLMRSMCSNAQHSDPVWISELQVPKVSTIKVMRDPLPTFEELRASASTKYVSDSLVADILATGVQPNNMVSVDSFFDYCTEVFKADKLQYRYMSMQEHYQARSEVELLGLNLYASEINTLTEFDAGGGEGMYYSDALDNIGFSFADYTQQDFYDSAITIFKASTGVGTRSTTTQSDIQKAMVSLFTELSSYSIQVVQDTSVANLVPLHLPGVMLGDIHVRLENSAYINGAPVTITDTEVSVTNKTSIDTSVPIKDAKVVATSAQLVDVGLDVIHRNSVGYNHRLNVELKVDSSSLPVSYFNSMDITQKSYLVDGWGYNSDAYLTVLQAPLGKFILQPTQRDVTLPTWNNADLVVAPMAYTGGYKSLDINTPLVSNKTLNSFTWSIQNKDNLDLVLSGNRKDLTDQRFSAGYVSIPSPRYTGNTKLNNDKAFSPVSKDIEFTITPSIKHLNILQFGKPFKSLNGFVLGSNVNGVAI